MSVGHDFTQSERLEPSSLPVQELQGLLQVATHVENESAGQARTQFSRSFPVHPQAQLPGVGVGTGTGTGEGTGAGTGSGAGGVLHLEGSGPCTTVPWTTTLDMLYEDASKSPGLGPPHCSSGTQPVHSDPYRITPLLCISLFTFAHVLPSGVGLYPPNACPSLKIVSEPSCPYCTFMWKEGLP